MKKAVGFLLVLVLSLTICKDIYSVPSQDWHTIYRDFIFSFGGLSVEDRIESIALYDIDKDSVPELICLISSFDDKTFAGYQLTVSTIYQNKLATRFTKEVDFIHSVSLLASSDRLEAALYFMADFKLYQLKGDGKTYKASFLFNSLGLYDKLDGVYPRDVTAHVKWQKQSKRMAKILYVNIEDFKV